jgi:hypothetical protein
VLLVLALGATVPLAAGDRNPMNIDGAGAGLVGKLHVHVWHADMGQMFHLQFLLDALLATGACHSRGSTLHLSAEMCWCAWMCRRLLCTAGGCATGV